MLPLNKYFLPLLFLTLLIFPARLQANEDLIKLDVARDIIKMASGDEDLELFDTPQGSILVANICDMKEISALTPLVERLDNAGVENSRELLNAFQEIVRIAEKKMTDDGNIPVTEFAGFLSRNPKSGSSMYQGYRLLGEWQCHAGKPFEPGDTVPFWGIFMNSTQAALFQPLSRDRVQVWLAPFKSAPSDALTFSFSYQDNKWRVGGICSSMRL